jgi:hypothetical protein
MGKSDLKATKYIAIVALTTDRKVTKAAVAEHLLNCLLDAPARGVLKLAKVKKAKVRTVDVD